MTKTEEGKGFQERNSTHTNEEEHNSTSDT